MAGICYYILDTETSGIMCDYHDLIEISIIRYNDRLQLNRIIKADNPNRASYDALKITNKTIDDLYLGVSKKEAISDVEEFFAQDGYTPAHRCIVAHNESFDRRFLHHAWEKNNKQFPADLWLCSLAICRRIAKEQGLVKPKLNLHAACDLFGIEKIAAAHNAKDDTRNTYMLFQHFMDKKIPYIDLIKRIPHNRDEE
jgi:DNA polymerase III alpha subunit (gram-positive type)